MDKTKGLIVGTMVLLALSLPAPSVQASELVKLGKLLVTGKRVPSAEAKPGADKPAPPPRAEPVAMPAPAAERQSAQAAPTAAGRPATDVVEVAAQGYDWAERQAQDASRSHPTTEAAPRTGRSPAPAPGMEAGV